MSDFPFELRRAVVGVVPRGTSGPFAMTVPALPNPLVRHRITWNRELARRTDPDLSALLLSPFRQLPVVEQLAGLKRGFRHVGACMYAEHPAFLLERPKPERYDDGRMSAKLARSQHAETGRAPVSGSGRSLFKVGDVLAGKYRVE